MEIRLAKQPQKYLSRVDRNTRRKLDNARDRLARLEGNSVPLGGQKNRYR